MYYIASILDTISIISIIVLILSSIALIIGLFWFIGCYSDYVPDRSTPRERQEVEVSGKFLKISTIILLISLVLVILVPGKETYLKSIAKPKTEKRY